MLLKEIALDDWVDSQQGLPICPVEWIGITILPCYLNLTATELINVTIINSAQCTVGTFLSTRDQGSRVPKKKVHSWNAKMQEKNKCLPQRGERAGRLRKTHPLERWRTRKNKKKFLWDILSRYWVFWSKHTHQVDIFMLSVWAPQPYTCAYAYQEDNLLPYIVKSTAPFFGQLNNACSLFFFSPLTGRCQPCAY